MSRHDDYEFWRLAIEDEPFEAFRIWGQELGEAIESGRFSRCRHLLRAAKAAHLPLFGRGYVRAAEAKLLEREGNQRLALISYRKAMVDFHAAGLHQLDPEILAATGAILHELGELEEAARDYDLALASLCSKGPERGRLLNNLGGLMIELKKSQDALACLGEAIELLDAAGDVYNGAAARAALGDARKAVGEPAKALDLYLDAAVRFESSGSPRGVLQVAGKVGLLYWATGSLDAARQQFEILLPRLQELGDAKLVHATLTNLGGVYYDMGDHEAARQHFSQALVGFQPAGNARLSEAMARRLLALGLPLPAHAGP